MATRLYPSTECKATLEALAGVSPGSFEQLEALENASYEGEDPGWEKHRAIHADRNTGELSDFIVFGWGRLSEKARALIESWGLDLVGDTTGDATRVKALLIAQLGEPDFDVDRVKELYWV